MNWSDAIEFINRNPKVNPKDIGYYLGEYAQEYGINSIRSQASFLANFLHETDNLNSLEEYASGAAYEGRADLGNTQPGDGKKFKGRGGFMITGRANYSDVSQHLFGDDRLLKSPDLLLLPKYAVQSSLYYWKSRGLTALADKERYDEVVKRINGGYNGLTDRTQKLNKLLEVFSTDPIGGTLLSSIIPILLIAALTYFIIQYYHG